jgi:hypothetical protein
MRWHLSDSDSSAGSRQLEDTENPHWSSQWGFPNAYLDDEFEDDSESFDESEDYSQPYDQTIAQVSGLVCSGKWPYPSDVFSIHEMSSVSSSDSNCASSSSSEPSLLGSDGLPAESVFFEITEDDRDRLRLHAATSEATWTRDYAVNMCFPVYLNLYLIRRILFCIHIHLPPSATNVPCIPESFSHHRFDMDGHMKLALCLNDDLFLYHIHMPL